MKDNIGKIKVLGTGLNGLVGSRIVELLSGKFEFENMSRRTGTDITDRDAVLNKVKNSSAEIVFHLAAKTDVDGCENDKVLGKDGEAWRINVHGTENVVRACESVNKKLIFMSTDFVFGGDDTPKGGYTENNTPNPLNWYAKTKYEGEKIIQDLSNSWVIVRIAYPYRANFEKKEYVRIFLWLLQQGKQIKAITDHIITPTFVDDVSYAFEKLLALSSSGIYHITGSQATTPYNIALQVAKEFNLDGSLIGKTTRAEYFRGRAYRPFDLTINNDKIQKLGISMRGFTQGVKEIKRQMVQNQ